MLLTSKRLREFYVHKSMVQKSISAKIFSFHKHPLLESCLAPLIPYFDMQENFPENIASLKITRAITILTAIDKDIASVLADFDKPRKIDIIAFMQKNFMFNMPLQKFAYLT